ncbi:MAG: hypothetical protein M1363_01830 [Gammaproteobacteria bacterium]|nr:hypothetical protein [Gammaproteobacteria bacterium]
MLLKEKVYLSNCDSVRALPATELQKRFLLGLTMASGVVLSPNTIMDNHEIAAILTKRNVQKYLNEEGVGRLVVHGFNISKDMSLDDYFDSLPENYIISSLDGSPKKKELTLVQVQAFRQRLRDTERALRALQPHYKAIEVAQDSLQQSIFTRLADPEVFAHYFKDDGERQLFMLRASGTCSRSDWYHFAHDFFDNNQRFAPNTEQEFRLEVIDPAYHSLFVEAGDGFLQDRIKHLTEIPQSVLDAGLTIKSLQRELMVLAIPYKLFQLVSALGAGELAQFIYSETINYAETRLVDKGYDGFTRKNWFGLYPKLRHYIGLEIKQ